MTLMRKLILLTSLAAIMAATLAAAPITYRFSGSGSGTIGRSVFEGADFVATINGDTTSVTSQPSLGALGALGLSGNISIAGLGVFAFADPLFVFIVEGTGFFGFGNFVNGNLITANSPAVVCHDLASNFGPTNVGANVNLSQFNNAATSGGALTFGSMSDVTYQAITGVPEPATVLLIGAGMASVLVLRRRRLGRR